MAAPLPHSSPALDAVLGWLRCPVCGRPLHRDQGTRSVHCTAGHSFDIAKQGYLNLLNAAPPRNADTPAMLDARQRFLASGLYQPIAEALARRCAGRRRIAEVGAGTGYYLRQVLDADPGVTGLALDVSAAACRKAARDGLASVVADTWAGLPVRDRAVDAVVCVFAPRNPAEFARILAPGGIAIVASPNPGHLAGLRADLGLLEVAPDKAAGLASGFAAAGFEQAWTQALAYQRPAEASVLTDLVLMGPNAFHDPALPTEPGLVEVDVQLTAFTRPQG